jgi:hypothetical protein
VTWFWFYFGVVMPAIIAGGGWLAAYLHMRSLRRHDARPNRPAE